MDKSFFDFELKDKYKPEVVIKNLLKQVEEATRGFVTGSVEDYEGPIRSYTAKTGIAVMSDSLQGASRTVNIQDKLGKQDEAKHRYEVFLSVKGLKYYKYRIMFVDYGTVSYPVMIVMNEELAEEYTGKRIDTFYIKSMKDLEDMVNGVINSQTMVSLLQNLISEALRRKNEDNEEFVLETEDIPDEN